MKNLMYYNFLNYSKVKKKKISILMFRAVKAYYNYLFKKKTTARFTYYGDELIDALMMLEMRKANIENTPLNK